MEVSGKRRDPDLDTGSADTTVFCQPCEEGGKRAEALGFCQTCEEFMCDPCIEAHKRFKVSRNHNILCRDQMPSFYPPTNQSDIGETEYCTNHPKEMMKFYCRTHGDLGCIDCFALDHRNCRVDNIADVAKDFINGKEFRELEPFIKQAEDLLSVFIRNVKVILDVVKSQSKVDIIRVRTFRAEINTYLDRREKKLLDSIRKVETEDETLLAAFKANCESTKSGLDVMRTDLSSSDISVNQRYVVARRAQKDGRFWMRRRR